MEALTAMGFPDHMCAKAMRMTGGDVEAAANYIMGMLPTQHTRARARAQVAAGSGVCGLRHLLPRLAQHPRPCCPDMRHVTACECGPPQTACDASDTADSEPDSSSAALAPP